MMQNKFYQHLNMKARLDVNDIMNEIYNTDRVNFHNHFYKIISAF